MNKTLQKIKDSRPDLSEYLFHFTKGANAIDTLWKIVLDEEIKDIKNTGVICFTETPVYNLVDMFKIFEGYANPMYAPYGIAIPKEKIFNLGGRQVIYGPKSEINYIHSSQHWRYEIVNSKNDFSWLREWRIPIKGVKIDTNECFLVTKTKDEDLEIAHYPEVEIDGDWADGQWWDQRRVAWERTIKSISIESLTEGLIEDSVKLRREIERQKIGEES